MALVLDASWGTSTANSYATIAEADDYHQRRYHSDSWIALPSATKTSLLVWATSLVDQLFLWDGNKVLQSQSLQCPRYGLYDINSWPIDMVQKPQWISDSIAEYAYHLYNSDMIQDYDEDQTSSGSSDLAGFKEITVGPITLKSSIGESSGSSSSSKPPLIPTSVLLILKPYGVLVSSRPKRLIR